MKRTGERCPYSAARHGDLQERYRSIIENVHGGHMLSHYVDAITPLRCRCSNGHIFNISPGSLRAGRWCATCNLSYGKRAVEEYLKNRDIQYVSKYVVDIQREKGGMLKFDFALLDGERLICLIQYDGEGYFSLGEDTIEVESSARGGELTKSRYCEKQGIPLIRISCFDCAPGMGDNLVVKVHYALGSRKR